MERCALGKEQTRAPCIVSECKEEHIKWLHDILKIKSISVNIARSKKLKKHGQCVAMGCSKERWKTPDSLLRQRGFGGWRSALCECRFFK
jgi:hypothetical protein